MRQNVALCGKTQTEGICSRQIRCCCNDDLSLWLSKNTVETGENAGYQHFLLVPQCFPKPSSLGLLKVGIMWLSQTLFQSYHCNSSHHSCPYSLHLGTALKSLANESRETGLSTNPERLASQRIQRHWPLNESRETGLSTNPERLASQRIQRDWPLASRKQIQPFTTEPCWTLSRLGMSIPFIQQCKSWILYSFMNQKEVQKES